MPASRRRGAGSAQCRLRASFDATERERYQARRCDRDDERQAHGEGARALVARYPSAAGKVFTLAGYATGEHKDVPDAWSTPTSFHDSVTA